MCKKRNIYTMAELATALQTTFNRLNVSFFEAKLERCIITVKDGERHSAYGWITCAKTWKQGNTERHEINIASEYLDRTIYDVIGTLLHEMVHLYNIMKGVQDTSRGGTYHNKAFKAAAEAHHLTVEQVPKYGFCRTALDEEARAWVDEHCPVQSFRVCQKRSWSISVPPPQAGGSGDEGSGAEGDKPKPPRKPSSTRKYVCPSCGMSIRATRDVNILCGDCMEALVKQD